MDSYEHQSMEPKWQAAWAEAQAFRAAPIPAADKAYVLDMFPYPSGSGLHVGHLLGYTGSDVVARYYRLQGKEVLHPMGWDAFGLPAENFAIKSGVHPALSTVKNIAEYKRQLTQAGMSYDWSREMATSDPAYYKWTQWFFSLLYSRGLAYRKEGLVNWCPKCQTVLANEQVVHGRCERCDTPVIQKQLNQWYFKITDYAERLLNDLDELDWPEKIKAMQRNWIGKSEGAKVWFKVEGRDDSIEVFTTRADTLFGATYVVIAPEHPLAMALATDAQKGSVRAYLDQAAAGTELERTFTDREKTGVFTGSYAINPVTKQPVPIWVADYVLGSYGTGAVMAVPAHDERDHAFALAFGLPIVQVVEAEELPGLAKGRLINSGEFTGRDGMEALDGILALAGGERTITYRLRDWLVSRQRFWGAPIPIAYDQDGKEYLLPESQLPVELPMDVEFLPTGRSPLADAEDWKRYHDPETGKELVREADTLDTFVCSSWYYLRFPNPAYAEGPFDPEAARAWLPVDAYIGGAEHAVLHLLYARFFTKVLFDAGYVGFQEPFTRLRNQGIILGPDHNKMSKSKGNVINPDDVVKEYGADTLRMYELFMAPFEVEKPWSTQGIVGVRRFLDRLWKMQESLVDVATAEEEDILHRLIAKVSEGIQDYRFNTAVAAMMEALNSFSELPGVSKATYRDFIVLLNPFAPHITEELWARTGGEGFCSLAAWPVHDQSKVLVKDLEYPVQIGGKVRFKVSVSAETSDEDIVNLVKGHEKYGEWVSAEPKKIIVVPGRLVSIVV